MKVFISWSGERSKAIATELREFLPDVIQAVDAFMSESDMDAGSRWADRLNQELQSTNVGIVCLTPENIAAPWVLFEAGALSKVLDKSFVCPYLLDLAQSDVKWPLAQFHNNLATKEGTRKIVESVNSALADNALSESLLERGFQRCWPDFEAKISAIPKPKQAVAHQRTERELLEELVGLVREQSRTVKYVASTGDWQSTLLAQYREQFSDMMKSNVKNIAAIRLIGTRELHLIVPRAMSFSKQYLSVPDNVKKLESSAAQLLGFDVAVKLFVAEE